MKYREGKLTGWVTEQGECGLKGEEDSIRFIFGVLLDGA